MMMTTNYFRFAEDAEIVLVQRTERQENFSTMTARSAVNGDLLKQSSSEDQTNASFP